MYKYLIVDDDILHVMSVKHDRFGFVCEAHVLNGQWKFKRDENGKCYALSSNGFSYFVENEWFSKEILEINSNYDLYSMNDNDRDVLINNARIKANELNNIQATNCVI